ncbi:hypothetical protein J7E91_05845 [Streptomyces sp. ISL-99]|uniref:alpha/beta hydrolase n=1 Tax=Streptomyces sp. ISL-99 TaxID=2819193 RepID=UPI001BE66154|nr:alpha/beta hydrolase [Streptomyces sp. ISL-99]MBT2524974.1 hypothetical protein [Streptomyces sp. ISL-99]
MLEDNVDDVMVRFAISDTRHRLQMAQDPATSNAVRALLGNKAFIELEQLSRSIPGYHLAAEAPTDLIFVPGVMGSTLASLGLAGIWWFDFRNLRHINDLRLSVDGVEDENPAHRVAPVAVDVVYEAFFAAVIKHESFGALGFPYDWRKPLVSSAERLREDILKVNSLNGHRPVHLVAHSMGGLVVRTALMRFPELWRCIGKVVFLGTPHYGSPAIGGYLKNHLWGFERMVLLGKLLSRETFRSMWGVLSLLPAPVGVYPGTRNGETRPGVAQVGGYAHPCGNFDFYRASAWNLGLSSEQEDQLQRLLSAADAHHRELYSWHMNLDQSYRNRMAVIAGVGFNTLFRLAYNRRLGILWEHMDRVTLRNSTDRHREGDGRVPLPSAELDWVQTRYVHAEHGSLPTIPLIYDDVLRFLSDQAMQLPTTPQSALQTHLAGDVLASTTPALIGTRVRHGEDPHDPGYLDFHSPPEAEVQVLERELRLGELPEFARLKIL